MTFFFFFLTLPSLFLTISLWCLLSSVYKGMATYDYIKAQRQKETRKRDVEAGIPHAAKIGRPSKETQVR